MPHTNIQSGDILNLQGMLFERGKRPKTTLSLIGGMGSVKAINSREFECGQEFQVGDHTSLPERLEGAVAPDHASVTRTPSKNVLEIVHESVASTYTQQGASQQLSQGAGIAIDGSQGGNPVTDEYAFQTGVKMEKIQRQMNYRILNQVYQNPGSNSTARKTRGFLNAIVSNVVYATDTGVAGGVAEDLTEDHIDELFAKMIAEGASRDGDEIVMLANTVQLRKVNKIFKNDTEKVESRTVAGTTIRTLHTALGVVHFALEQDLPQDVLLYVNFGVVGLKGLAIPRKPGILFREPLGKRGSLDEQQIYGELGLDHGPEWMHGVVRGLKSTI